jgi:hypothetical protein
MYHIRAEPSGCANRSRVPSRVNETEPTAMLMFPQVRRKLYASALKTTSLNIVDALVCDTLVLSDRIARFTTLRISDRQYNS